MNLDLARRSSAAVGSASSEKEARGDKPKSSKEELGGVVNRDVAWWMMAGRTSRLDLNATTDVHWTWITGSVSRPSSRLGDRLLLFSKSIFTGSHFDRRPKFVGPRTNRFLSRCFINRNLSKTKKPN
jgi:hypothetical protein